MISKKIYFLMCTARPFPILLSSNLMSYYTANFASKNIMTGCRCLSISTSIYISICPRFQNCKAFENSIINAAEKPCTFFLSEKLTEWISLDSILSQFSASQPWNLIFSTQYYSEPPLRRRSPPLQNFLKAKFNQKTLLDFKLILDSFCC